MSISITTTPCAAPTVILVDDEEGLVSAILHINNSPSGNYVVDLAPASGGTITPNQDLPVLNAGGGKVKIVAVGDRGAGGFSFYGIPRLAAQIRMRRNSGARGFPGNVCPPLGGCAR